MKTDSAIRESWILATTILGTSMAFVDGFRVVMGILAGLALLAAGVAYRGLGPARG